MAHFQKGHQLSKGRPKGSRNKNTVERLKKIAEIVRLLEKELKVDLKAMKQSERVELWKDLQEYFVPKQQRANVEGDQNISINLTVDKEDMKV